MSGRARPTCVPPPQAGAQPPASHCHASVQDERQAMPGALRDGAGTTAAMAARAGAGRRPHVLTWHTSQEGGEVTSSSYEGGGPVQHAPEPSQGHGGAGASTPASRRPSSSSQGERQPTDVTPSWSAVEQPPSRPPYGGVPEERQATPGGARPHGRSPTIAVPVERVSTLKQDDGVPGGSPPQSHAHTRPQTSTGPPRKARPMMLPTGHEKKRPGAWLLTACCIVFWLLVIIVGVAVLIVYLHYRPQPPQLRVTTATLNAGYIDELGGGGLALNSDLTVLAAIANPNTKIDVVLHYMQLDLLFHGSLIGTQAVWPAPLQQGPGGSVLRSVHLVVSEVTMTQQDVMAWQNATSKGGLVPLQLVGRFQTQLNFGRWYRFNYWVYPRCTLLLDPPPGGALRRARCS